MLPFFHKLNAMSVTGFGQNTTDFQCNTCFKIMNIQLSVHIDALAEDMKAEVTYRPHKLGSKSTVTQLHKPWASLSGFT